VRPQDQVVFHDKSLVTDHGITITKYYILYSWKIWQELKLADWPQQARTKILAGSNLADS
jgi:hypothetical protein